MQQYGRIWLEHVNILTYDRLLRIIITTGIKAEETRGDY
jgi:hypothetical protein